MGLLMTVRKNGGYSRMEKEDPDEKKHRQAQFLIYKIMEQASNGTRIGICSQLGQLRSCKSLFGKAKVETLNFPTALVA
ncbi:hypothetical protein E5676_scaffold248G005820 [Cucumis melo var. makuwa]|uniref:Uncharacterized protein n=1 Tax=Cucumis melo var. makuwa TaxID=1194695 RepID=A0A5A7UTN2_CUCMM|nr:hypothetical protein E6C27_scaffold96G00300 [Cucumis melo var. makuwa]TYJ99364.1 hypothetical protein E5676_scaffold248G005820 [Cucumis melo var. makuwa]